MVFFLKRKKLALTAIIEFISPVIIDAWMNVQVETLFISGYHGLYTTIPWSSNNRNR